MKRAFTVMVLVAAMIVPAGLFTSGAGAAAHRSRSPSEFNGTRYHVDCEASAAGDGTRAAPWTDLEAANEVVLEPGDSLMLRRGTACVGMLKPQGSGSAEHRIRIGAYGHGPLPRIDAEGIHHSAVHLEDVSHIVVKDLELTNRGNLTEPHRGVYVTPTQTKMTDVEIRDLYIHDVTGLVTFNGTAKRGGAIIGDSQFQTTETQIDGVLIENNRIEDVGRSGIYFDATTASTSDRPRASEPWPAAGQNIVIRGNTLKRLQGDAIVAHGTSGAVIEHNVVSVGNLAGRDWLSADRNCSAGIWSWNSINTLIQYNEVSDYRFGQSATDGCDGTGFDIDNEQEGTVIQYNYSHNNEGGFILFCSDDEPHAGIVRYNLSIDDGKVINLSPCKFPTVGTFSDLRVYNNTFVMPKPLAALETFPLNTIDNAGDFQFANNIVYATSPTTESLACGDRCSNNLFYNMPPSGTDVVIGDPLFEDVTWRGSGLDEALEAFRILPGSPAVSAGQEVVDPPPKDYFGTRIPTPPSIGMHEPRCGGAGWEKGPHGPVGHGRQGCESIRPKITPGATAVTEGDEGTATVDVPVTLSRPSATEITVDWATFDVDLLGVAVSGNDYQAASGTVTFAPGEMRATVPITVFGDDVVESPLLWGEWGLIAFSNPSANATLERSFFGLGAFVIVDDDA